MVPSVQQCMDNLVGVFHSYSKKEGDKYMLNYAELKLLLNKELSAYLGACKNPSRVNEIMSDMDKNKDGAVDFQEFVTIVAKLTVLCHDFFVGTDKVSPKPGWMRGVFRVAGEEEHAEQRAERN
ncbi:protein S100-A1-like [Cheilinus undulatus]|uniref:protein S100-A1-like n=1 Tax=Cheilinus undulatus TaxID=241271 RepID=UPI001BD46675|nr:protein S100-A1-like [Cheilinus undulatus]